jgi:hypothetical protein
MASERDTAKKAIKDTEATEPEFTAALAQGQEQQHRITTENNRHKEFMRTTDLGWFGRAFGGEVNAPFAIAALVVICGVLGAFLAGYMASKSQRPDAADYWSKQVERSAALAMTSLSFIFGRSGRK